MEAYQMTQAQLLGKDKPEWRYGNEWRMPVDAEECDLLNVARKEWNEVFGKLDPSYKPIPMLKVGDEATYWGFHGVNAHCRMIRSAIKAGKTIPPEVLADYPNEAEWEEWAPFPLNRLRWSSLH